MEQLPTFFAPAERDPVDEQCRLCKELASEPLLQPLLDSFPGPALILNRLRQAVAVNEKLVALLQIPAGELLGLRPGEMLDCIRWREGPWGCGTSVFCRACEALRAVLNSQQNQLPDVEDCHINVFQDAGGKASTLDLRVWATPITIGGHPLTVVAVQEICGHTCSETRNKL
jgi:hypothetical protein